MSEEPKTMTRAEKIAIRSERVRLRRAKMNEERIAEGRPTLEEEEAMAKEGIEIPEVPTKDTGWKPDVINKDKLDIEICIHTFHYQRRLCWMLSSILQQEGNVPNITVSISHTDNDGDPTTAEVCEFFRNKGLTIKEQILTEAQVKNRAIGRNLQVADTNSDWMLFADSDMVYSPHFFEDIQKQLKTTYSQEAKVLGADRISLDIPFCIKYFEEDTTKYPCVIPNVSKIAEEWPVKWVTGRGTCAGNFQLANTQAIMYIADGKYTGREGDVWRHTKSDRAFRCRMGGRKPMKTLPQHHLNHDRGGPEIQR
ncbi:glycosyltransferase family 2 protein [bacterium]|nr:MAG: glycosyltransferase family 2 protein [bacterium]